MLAAEKIYGAGKGDEKLAYAEKVLEQHHIRLDLDTLKAIVDAEIKKPELAEHKEPMTIVPEVLE